MVRRRGPRLTAAQKAEVWRRWRQGQSLTDIARALGRVSAADQPGAGARPVDGQSGSAAPRRPSSLSGRGRGPAGMGPQSAPHRLADACRVVWHGPDRSVTSGTCSDWGGKGQQLSARRVERATRFTCPPLRGHERNAWCTRQCQGVFKGLRGIAVATFGAANFPVRVVPENG